jgi:predicted phosphodiesterase
VRSTADPRVEVFAVEPSAAQLVVRSRYDGDHAVSVGTRTALASVRDGVGAAVVDRLEVDTAYTVAIDGRPAATLRTLPAPPGRFLGRFATVSDLHVGETGFGRAPRLHLSTDAADAHPVVCLRAALTELRDWGAEAVVVKGDLTHDSRAAEYDLAGRLLASCGLPLWVIPGNHDGGNHRHDDGGVHLARHQIVLHEDTIAVELAGLQVVLANTVHPGREHGFAPLDDTHLFELLGRGLPTLLVLHHQLMTTPFPYYLPPGIYGPAANRLLERIVAANPATMVTTGHTHRHRRRRHGPVVISEVGSTKDHPGTWGGYLVYEGGIVQTVRRIMDAEALAWTERTRRSALGAWGRWSPGRLTDRCFTHAWPAGAGG